MITSTVPINLLRSPYIGLFAAFTIGLAMPLMMFGRAVMQSDLAIALLVTLALGFARPGTYSRAINAGELAFKIALVTTAIAWLPGMVNSLDLASSLKAWARTFLFIAGAGVMWSLLSGNDTERRFCLKVLVTASLTAFTISLISINAWPELINFLRGRPVDVLAKPALLLKSFGATAMCLVPVLWWSGQNLGGRWAWASYAGILMAMAVVFATANRASIAGLLAMAVIVTALMGIRDKRTRLPLLLGAPLVVAGAFVWLHYFGPTFLDNPDTYLPVWLIDPHRQSIWKFTLERALETPWFGHGIDTINLQSSLGQHLEKNLQTEIPSHPHNWVMEIFSETGFVGLLSLFATLLILCIRLAKNVLANIRPQQNLALLALSTGFWASSLFNFSIWSTWWLLTYFVLFAIVASRREA